MSTYGAFCPRCDSRLTALAGTGFTKIENAVEVYEYLTFDENGEVEDEGPRTSVYKPNLDRDDLEWDDDFEQRYPPILRCRQTNCKRWVALGDAVMKEIDEDGEVITQADEELADGEVEAPKAAGHLGEDWIGGVSGVTEGDYVCKAPGSSWPGDYEGAAMYHDDDDGQWFVVPYDVGDYPDGDWDQYEGLWVNDVDIYKACPCNRCRERRTAQRVNA